MQVEINNLVSLRKRACLPMLKRQTRRTRQRPSPSGKTGTRRKIQQMSFVSIVATPSVELH
jgi:hypothetical protein